MTCQTLLELRIFSFDDLCCLNIFVHFIFVADLGKLFNLADLEIVGLVGNITSFS